MAEDFYCDKVLSGKIKVDVISETANVLAFRHTHPFWETHIVVIPKRHIASLIAIDKTDESLLLELLEVIRKVAKEVFEQRGAARVLTNLGEYQDSKHLHFHVYAGEEIKRTDAAKTDPS
jgi:histidine triad (HIT) family protein